MKTLIVLALLLVAAPLGAQTGAFAVPVNTSFNVLADITGTGATAVRLRINGTQVGAEIPAPADGQVRFTVPAGLPVGTHQIDVVTVNVFGATPSSVMLQTGSAPLPAKGVTVVMVTVTISGGPTGAEK